ncbi:lipase secretion chaperone [Massilia sp. CF038]|uniref:lipase secretion chaperone n=1 Tax=Massilia sp. CF038 TaxID=1881045 RepID=UPI00091F6015|nr:lipase secretion chaperone [Massilia sp. CF038]SHH66788.1 Lipase chaperone LimK [Massilia sp. CF038]
MTALTTMTKVGAGAVVAALLYAAFAPSAPPVPVAPAAAPASDPFAFVRSMEGTRPDGDVRTNPDGELVIDAELGHLFDYYLAGMGEKDLRAIRAEIERELDKRLKPGPAAQAKRLLASYLDYKAALVNLEAGLKPGDMAAAARARLQAMQKLRLQFFTEKEIAGLFGFSDAYDNDALARMEISTDAKLSVAQRAEKLAALDAKLSPAMREEREAPTRVIRTEEAVQKLRAQGASDDEVYRLRAAAFTPEGASRLAELDREEAAWKSRIQVYLAERRQLAPDALAAVQQLRDKYFSADEQRRLPAYE